jgi:hypothetical protein
MQQLPQNWASFLAHQPETGMGYQVVAVTLRDGRRIEDVAIVGSLTIAEVRGYESIPFAPADILAVEVTHRKWPFRHV